MNKADYIEIKDEGIEYQASVRRDNMIIDALIIGFVIGIIALFVYIIAAY